MARRKTARQMAVQNDWESRIEGWKLSGLSQAKYCEVNNLSIKSFQYWRRQLKNMQTSEAVQENSDVRIVEIKPEKHFQKEQLNVFPDLVQIKFSFRNFQVELKNNFSEEALRRLIKVLQSV